MRPGFLLKETAAPEQRRIFVGRYAPGPLLRPELLPFVPDLEGLRFQVLHTDDAAEAFRLAVLRDVRGPFNLTADPVIDASVLADLLDARIVRIPRTLVRTALTAARRVHAVPASPHLFGRAHDVLGWRPTRTAEDAMNAFLRGVRTGTGDDTARNPTTHV